MHQPKNIGVATLSCHSKLLGACGFVHAVARLAMCLEYVSGELMLGHNMEISRKPNSGFGESGLAYGRS